MMHNFEFFAYLNRNINDYLTDEEIAILRAPPKPDFESCKRSLSTITEASNEDQSSHKDAKSTINIEHSPKIIHKKHETELSYIQELAVTYLKPPNPPKPGPIIISIKKKKSYPPPPPLIYRQQPARVKTPSPFIIREVTPQPPKPKSKVVIILHGKKLPPPPRKVVVEKLPNLQSKPQPILIERWLAYDQSKQTVYLRKKKSDDVQFVKTKNVIIQWETPEREVTKKVNYLGTIRADPAKYAWKYGVSN